MIPWHADPERRRMQTTIADRRQRHRSTVIQERDFKAVVLARLNIETGRAGYDHIESLKAANLIGEHHG